MRYFFTFLIIIILETPSGKMEIILPENGKSVLIRRYLRKDPVTGIPIETIGEMVERIVEAIASAQATSPEEKERLKVAYHSLFDGLRFLPNTPVFTGAGTPLAQMAACFVLPVVDDLGRVPGSIFDTLKNAALIQQSGGGVGFSFGQLRHSGDIVAKSAGHASGPVSFMEVYDKAFGAIAQGGCLIPSTLVNTEYGTLRLDEIIPPGTGAKQWTPHSVMVPVPYGKCALSRFGYNNGMSDLMKVTLNSGITLTGTPEHKVRIAGTIESGPVAECEWEWKELSLLRDGDIVVSLLDRHMGRYQRITTYTPVGYPTILCEKVAFTAGVVNACGLFTPETGKLTLLGFLSEDSRGMGMIREIDQVFDWMTRNTSEFAKFFLENKLMTTDGSVPLAIRKSPKSVVASYMRGFFEAGLRATASSIDVVTKSQDISQEIAVLLRGIGVPAAVRDKGDTVIVTQLSAWFALVGVPDYSRFKILQTSDMFHPPGNDVIFDIVQKVDKLPEKGITYDVQVDEEECYYANGMLTHNTRRGASMGSLPVDHPDILQFISCKVGEKAITNFNISVAVTDKFMEQSMTPDGEYDLISPRTHLPVSRITASKVMDEIVHYAHSNGEPGILFIDRLNESNPLPHMYRIETTNPW